MGFSKLDSVHNLNWCISFSLSFPNSLRTGSSSQKYFLNCQKSLNGFLTAQKNIDNSLCWMIHKAPLTSTPDLFLATYNSLLLKLLKTIFKRKRKEFYVSPIFFLLFFFLLLFLSLWLECFLFYCCLGFFFFKSIFSSFKYLRRTHSSCQESMNQKRSKPGMFISSLLLKWAHITPINFPIVLSMPKEGCPPLRKRAHLCPFAPGEGGGEGSTRKPFPPSCSS